MVALIVVLLIIAFNFDHYFASICISHSPSSDPEWHNEKVTTTCEGNFCIYESQSDVVRRGCSSINLNEGSKECSNLAAGRRRCYCTGDKCNKNYGSYRDRDRFSIMPKKNVSCFVCCPQLGEKCDEIAHGIFCASYKLDSRICLQAHTENRTFASEMPDYLFGRAKMCSTPDFYGTTSCFCNYNQCNINEDFETDNERRPLKTCCSGGSLKALGQPHSIGCTQKCLGNYCGLEYFEDDLKSHFAQFCLNSTDIASLFDMHVEFGHFHQRAFVCDENLCNEKFDKNFINRLSSISGDRYRSVVGVLLFCQLFVLKRFSVLFEL